MTILTVFFQMLSLLVMIAAGWLAAKLGMMDEHTNTKLSSLIVNFFNPSLILASAANSVGMVDPQSMLLVGMIAVGMFAALIALGILLARFFEQEQMQRKVYQLMFVFSNLGFIGIPVVSSILGSKYVVFVTEFILIYTIIFYTYGVALMDGNFSPSSLKSMFNPGTVLGLLALILILFNIHLPNFLSSAANYLGNATTPLALFAVGYTLAHSDLRRILLNGKLYIFSGLKLLAIPLLFLPFVRMVTDDAGIISVCMIMFGMPVGNLPLMLGTQKGIDCTNCSAAIVLTTVLCVLTIPVLLAVAG